MLSANAAPHQRRLAKVTLPVDRPNCRKVGLPVSRVRMMPEHLHLLVLPTTKVVEVDKFLSGLKRPHSVRIKRILEENRSPLLERLTVQERPGKTSFRYWQEGPGYDRNLFTEKVVMAAIDYIHENPVRRGLSSKATD